MISRLDRQTVSEARQNVGIFAEVLIGQPLWPHQLELARSDARIRCVCVQDGRRERRGRLP